MSEKKKVRKGSSKDKQESSVTKFGDKKRHPISNDEAVFWKIGKTPNFGHQYTPLLGSDFSFFSFLKKDRLCLIWRFVKFQQPDPFLKLNFESPKKIILNH